MIEPGKVTDIGLGTWVLGESMWKGNTKPHQAIKQSVNCGINLIDTAPAYGNGHAEKLVGKSLNKLKIREDVFLATKCGLVIDGDEVRRDCSPEQLRIEIRDSLERLDVDQIDLYQLHWPDKDVPFKESVEVLEEFRDKGWIRYIGVSNYSIDQIKEAQLGGTIDFLQPPFNLFERKPEENLLSFCEEQGIRTLVYGALCRGLLSGKYDSPDDIQLEEGDIRNHDPKFTDRSNDYIEAVHKIEEYLRGQGHEEGLAPLILRWTTEQPGVSCALVGARNGNQARSNARTLEIQLSAQEIDRIREIADNVIEDPVGPEFMAPPE